MKNFFGNILVQGVSVVAVISGLVTLGCLIGLWLNFTDDVINVLLFSVPILVASFIFLRIKKVTWEEFINFILPGFLPW